MVRDGIRLSLGRSCPVALGCGASLLALVALPALSGAGGEGRRVTLGANRAYDAPAPSYVLPRDHQGASHVWSRSLEPPRNPAAVAESLPVRVGAAGEAPGAATPEFKPAAEPTVAPRSERVQHGTVKLDDPKQVEVTVRPASVRVDAPTTAVRVGDNKVRVNAPFTKVAVDDGRVRVRAPFVNLDIRW